MHLPSPGVGRAHQGRPVKEVAFHLACRLLRDATGREEGRLKA